MSFFFKSLIVIVCVSILLVVQNFGELIVQRQPPDVDDTTRKLTCISEDDDSALIWNYDYQANDTHSGKITVEDFQPKKPTPKSVSECAFWNSTSCITSWGQIPGWDVVDSIFRPMGPAFDYRWEGFKELNSQNLMADQKYHYVSEIQSSGSVVFSARGKKNVYIYLCEYEDPINGLCFLIIIGGWDGSPPSIWYCLDRVLQETQILNIESCSQVVHTEHQFEHILDDYEWRTFRLTWSSDEGTIELFKSDDTEYRPLMKGYVIEELDLVPHMLIRCDQATRVRFHLYDYLLAQRKDAELSTPYFIQNEEDFCAELLVGMCPHCGFKIGLTDTNGHLSIQHSISGVRYFADDRPILWRSINLTTTLRRPASTPLQLKVQATLNEYRSMGQWAVGHFRACKPNGSLRKSTLTIHRDRLDQEMMWPKVKCQKLSYTKSAVVDSDTVSVSYPITTDRGIRYLANAALEKRCFNIVRMKDSIRLELRNNLEGCRTVPGLPHFKLKERSNTIWEHTVLSFPFTFGALRPNTEYDLTAYEHLNSPELWSIKVRTLPAAPGIVRSLEHLYYRSPTKIKLQWEVPLETNGIITKYTVTLQRVVLHGCDDLGKSTPLQDPVIIEVVKPRAMFNGLNPYALYTADVIAYTAEPGPKVSYKFNTEQTSIPTSVVSNLKLVDNQSILRWGKPEDCTTISGAIGNTFLRFTGVGDSMKDFNFTVTSTSGFISLDKLHLAGSTTYKVRVYVTRNQTGRLTTNPKLYQEKIWTTLIAAPSIVTNFKIFDADPETNTVTLRWGPPNPTNGDIESYHVIIMKKEIVFKNWTLHVSEGIPMCKLQEDYICIENFEIPSETGTELTLSVYAKNKGFEVPGNSTTLKFTPSLDYYKAPGEPLNLKNIYKGQGVVMISWMHPLFSDTKITRFEIDATVFETNLERLLGPEDLGQVMDYTFTKIQKYYSTMLYLLPSTRYEISVVAVSGRNKKSAPSYREFLVPTDLSFSNEIEPQVTFEGNFIDIKMPVVVNATRSTEVRVIVKGLSDCTQDQSQELSSSVNPITSVMEWDAASYPVENIPKTLKIFVEENQGVLSNCFLRLGETYTIVFNVTDYYTGASILFMASPIALTKHSLAWLAIFPVLALCMLVLFIYYRNRKRVANDRVSLTETNTIDSKVLYFSKNLIPEPEMVEDSSSTDLYTVPTEPDSCSVSIEYFEKYVKKSVTDGRLYSQFMLLRRGLTKPCEYGRLPKNIPKNRYGNLIAYDDTRVILEKISGDPYSDYINASYIKGYKKHKAYIAAQGPKPNTVNDFWRMVWQEKVRVICMLTNIIEGDKTKCEKYWPDVGNRVKYGELHVLTINDQVFADYTFRTFELSYKRDMRKITHLQYTGWPMHGVPTHPQSLVAYLRKLKETPVGNGPVVVHCNTGDGRTGTIILCVICLQQAAAEKAIDVTATITRMRDDRANMVDTLQQYLLAHIVITESIVTWPTQISWTDVLSTRIQRMRTQLPVDMERLNDSIWQGKVLQSTAFVSDDSEEGCSNLFEKESNRINAVSVDGVRVKKYHMASWLPSPLVLPDFWQLVVEKDIKLIIILQCSDPRNPTCIDIMPDESITVSMLDIRVENQGISEEGKYFTTEKLLLTDKSKNNARSQSVVVLTCKGWGCGENQKPPVPARLVSLWRASEKIPRKEAQTLVLCHDGITGCGLYLALSFLLEKLTVEKQCDVISAVRAVRRSRQEFVQSLEEFEYLYDAAVNYVERFQTTPNSP